MNRMNPGYEPMAMNPNDSINGIARNSDISRNRIQ